MDGRRPVVRSVLRVGAAVDVDDRADHEAARRSEHEADERGDFGGLAHASGGDLEVVEGLAQDGIGATFRDHRRLDHARRDRVQVDALTDPFRRDRLFSNPAREGEFARAVRDD